MNTKCMNKAGFEHISFVRENSVKKYTQKILWRLGAFRRSLGFIRMVKGIFINILLSMVSKEKELGKWNEYGQESL